MFGDLFNSANIDFVSSIGGIAEMIMKYSDNDYDLFEYFKEANQCFDIRLSNPYLSEIYKMLSKISF